MIDPNCQAGEHGGCEAVLEYGECTCSCHDGKLARMQRQAGAEQMNRRAALIRQANDIPHAGR
jgi:hypothetical protein